MMLKYLSLFLYFFTIFLYADETFYLQKNKNQDTASFITVKADLNDSLAVSQILADKNLTSVKKTNLGYISYPVWTKFTVQNDTEEDVFVMLKNPRAGMGKLDVYVYNDEKLLKKYEIGDTRPAANRAVAHRLNIIPLQIHKNESFTVVTKARNTGPTEIAWDVLTQSEFEAFSVKDSMMFGFFGGVTLALIIYNLAVFFSFRDISFIYYILYAIFAILYQYSIAGVFYEADLGVHSPLLHTILKWDSSYLAFVMLLLFGGAFLKTKQTMPTIYKIQIILTFLLLANCLFNAVCVYIPQLFAYGGILTLLVGSLSVVLLVIATVAYRKRLEGALYFLIGQWALVISAIVNLFALLGFLKLDFVSANIIFMGMFLDMVFLSLALSHRIKILDEQKRRGEKTLLDNSKLVAVSQVVAGIIHQLRQPIIHVGAQITRLEAYYDMKWGEKSPKEQEIISDLQETLSFMDKIVLDFYQLYSVDSTKYNFSPAEELRHVASMLSRSIGENAIVLTLDLDEQISIENLRHSFANCMMVLLENAVRIHIDRKTLKPSIKITLKQDGDGVLITVSDNAGGIKQKPIEKVFEMYESSKKEMGFGLGLSLAKNIVENKLNGSIAVKNDEFGAVFSVRLLSFLPL